MWGRFGGKLVFEIWASWVLWFWRWTFGIVGFVVSAVNYKFDNKEFRQCGQLWQWGASTTNFRATTTCGASHIIYIPRFRLSFLSFPTKWSSFPNCGKVRIFFQHFRPWPNFMGNIRLVLLVFFYILSQALWINHIYNCITFNAIFEAQFQS